MALPRLVIPVGKRCAGLALIVESSRVCFIVRSDEVVGVAEQIE